MIRPKLDSFTNDVNTLKRTLIDYLIWSTKSLRYREPASAIFLAFETFKKDAMIIFGNNLSKITREMYLDSRHGYERSKDLIEEYIYNERYLTEICAIIGLLARAANYWGGEFTFNNISAKIVLLFCDLVTDENLEYIMAPITIRMRKFNT
ncbi:protein B14 [BeAn 58058 virus]|uniref:protein B14 n=1 Tax=BeAn 58058 virus TaxID=67082 RepID=UPI00090A5963|nr:protein B14 [BeAn 58058 virus]APG58202.1 protein B14 [BeAn 58058 virus]